MISQLITSLAPALPYVFVGLVGFLLFTLVFLFKRFSGSRAEAEQTRQAVELELSFLGKLFRLGRRRTDPLARVEDPNKLTISRPIPAVPPPARTSAPRSIEEPPPEDAT